MSSTQFFTPSIFNSHFKGVDPYYVTVVHEQAFFLNHVDDTEVELMDVSITSNKITTTEYIRGPQPLFAKSD